MGPGPGGGPPAGRRRLTQQGLGRIGVCEDGLEGSANSNCLFGTDCGDCPIRELCLTCSDACRARIAERTDPLTGDTLAEEFCLDLMYTNRQTCYDACNNRDCDPDGCDKDAKLQKCTAEQALVSSYLTACPAAYDPLARATLPQAVTSARAPVAADLRIAHVSYSREGGEYHMAFNYELTLQWQDSRLAVSPCAHAYADAFEKDVRDASLNQCVGAAASNIEAELDAE